MKHWIFPALNAARDHVSWALRHIQYICVLVFTKVLRRSDESTNLIQNTQRGRHISAIPKKLEMFS